MVGSKIIFFSYNEIVLFFFFFLFISILFYKRGIFFFGGEGSSSQGSVVSSGSSSGSSSGGKDPKRSFWERYWKIILGIVCICTVTSVLVIFIYYYNIRVNESVDVGSVVGTVVQSDLYYYDWSFNSVPFHNVVMSNPIGEQYAPFKFWQPLLERQISSEKIKYFYEILKLNESDRIDRLVFNKDSFEELVSAVKNLKV